MPETGQRLKEKHSLFTRKDCYWPVR